MRTWLRKLLYWILPELRLFRNSEYDFSLLQKQRDFIDNVRHIILYAPYSISETEIGDYTYISNNSHISKAVIGKFCSIGPNLLCGWGIHPTNGISTSPMFYSTLKQNGVSLVKENKIEERKGIRIGNDVFIGGNVTILDGVSIGDGAIIGAGAVVSKDIPDYAIAIGCPIKILRYRFDDKQITALKQIRWWEFNEKDLYEVESKFFNLEQFIGSRLDSSC